MVAHSTSALLVSLAASFAVSQAAILSPGFTPSDVNRRGLLDPAALIGLQARQDNTQPNVPPQCVPSCGEVTSLIQNSCPPTQCCTVTFVQNYVTCLECVGTAAGMTDYSRGQASLHMLVEACNARGLPVTEQFLPGQSPTSTTTTASTTGTEPASITSQSTVRSVTSTSTPPIVSQSTVRSTDLPSATAPPPSASQTTGANSGAVGLSVGWALSLVAAGMGVLLF